jgi:hypothetical protein
MIILIKRGGGTGPYETRQPDNSRCQFPRKLISQDEAIGLIYLFSRRVFFIGKIIKILNERYGKINEKMVIYI